MSPIYPTDEIGPAAVDPSVLARQAPPLAPSTGSGFAELFGEGLARVNESLQASQSDMQRLAVGDVQNLHQVMIRMEESRLSFQLMVQVRNRLLESYQDIMKMQI
jgi:flagellar hook-basal body complex protein FliE